MSHAVGDELGLLRQMIAERNPRIIGVDGMNGAGKTTRVAKPLGRQVISLDDYLPGDGRYLKGLHYEALRSFVSKQRGPFVIEGCCLLAALAKVHIRIDLHVYVRRVSSTGRWEDEEVGTVEERDYLLAREMQIRRVTGSTSELDEDLINYHADHRPLQNASLVLDLLER